MKLKENFLTSWLPLQYGGWKRTFHVGKPEDTTRTCR